jgi:hypothetical protein
MIHKIFFRTKTALFTALVIIVLPINGSQAQQSTHPSIRKSTLPIPLLSPDLMNVLINEVSGEMSLNNESLLAGFEMVRSADEYQRRFHESKIIMQKLQEYGIEESGIEEVPVVLTGDKIWAPESAELWIVEPFKKKLTCLEDVPACLAEHSQTSDLTAELVYVGPGNRED